MALTKEEIEQFCAVMDEREKAKVPPKEELKRKFTGAEIGSPEDKLVADKMGGFKSAGHFYKEVINAAHPGYRSEVLSNWQDAVQKTAGYMEEGDAAQGGYTVPVQIVNTILERSLEASIVEPRASIQPMTSNRLEIPADVDNNHATNYFGGIIIYRTGEAVAKTPTNPTFRKVALTLHKLTGLCYVSDELLSDSTVALEAYLGRKFSQAIAFVKDDDFLNGNGANQALGAFNSSNPCLVTCTAVTGQGASTIIAENIVQMWSQLYPAFTNEAVWVANPETFPQLATMSLAVGTGGVPLWMPAGGMSGSPYATLMGRPIIFSEKMQALGTAGDIGLAAFSAYLVGQKGGGAPDIASSIHIKFVEDETAFRFVLRYDGQPAWASALTPKRGSKTLSPFVVLSSTRT